MKEFEYPEIEVIKFAVTDVVTVSGELEEGENDGGWG